MIPWAVGWPRYLEPLVPLEVVAWQRSPKTFALLGASSLSRLFYPLALLGATMVGWRTLLIFKKKIPFRLKSRKIGFISSNWKCVGYIDYINNIISFSNNTLSFIDIILIKKTIKFGLFGEEAGKFWLCWEGTGKFGSFSVKTGRFWLYFEKSFLFGKGASRKYKWNFRKKLGTLGKWLVPSNGPPCRITGMRVRNVVDRCHF